MPGRATAGGKTPPALPALGLRVAISTWAHAESLTGEVVEHWCALGEAHQFKVRYDLDKAECWHDANEPWVGVTCREIQYSIASKSIKME